MSDGDLKQRLGAAFELGHRPAPTQLVAFDGTDELDKEHVVELFGGHDREWVAEQLEEGHLGSLSDVEDLFVLEPVGFTYYALPYLQFALELEDPFDEPLIHQLTATLRDRVEARGRASLSDEQAAALVGWVQRCEALAPDGAGEDEWMSDLAANLAELRALLEG